MRVDVVAYDSRWPEQFQLVRDELERALVGVAVVAIEHVGSTSIPGLAAKPVIDVDVVVEDDDVAAAIVALASVGYVPLGDCGVPDRHAFDAPPHGPPRHVYVTVAGCLSVRNHLGVRGVLRGDTELRREYGELKLRLASQEFESIDDYVFAKSEVLQRVLRRAGLAEAELDAIDAVNRSTGRS